MTVFEALHLPSLGGVSERPNSQPLGPAERARRTGRRARLPALKERPMDQEANEWKTLFKRVNQLFRATTHPGVVQLPVEGLDAFARQRDRVAQLAATDNSRPAWPRRAGRLLDLHLHQLASHPALPAGLGPQVPGPRAGGDRRAHPRVRHRARPRQRPPSGQGPAGRAFRSRSTTTTGSGAPSTTTTGRPCTSSTPQGQIRHHRFGEGDYEESEMILQQLLAEAGAGGVGQDLVGGRAAGWRWPPTGPALWSPGELPRLRAHRATSPHPTVPSWDAARLRRPGAVAAQPLGPGG